MSKLNVTEGDWLVCSDTFIYALNSDGENQFTANIDGNGSKGASYKELKANAMLMAQAKNMYEMLEHLFNHDCISDCSLMKEVGTLLAKCRGEE